MLTRDAWAGFCISALALMCVGGCFPDRASASLHTATPYDAIAALPDWSGAWSADSAPSVLRSGGEIPFAPAYAARFADLRAKIAAGGAMPGNPGCKPSGMPLFMEKAGSLFDILFTPGEVIFESGSQENRIIYTDGRALPAESDYDFYNGTSVGHWEGDTLVVDTNGILPEAEIVPGIANDGGLHVHERIRLAAGKLEDQITLSGPAFAQPYSYTRTYTRHRDWDVTEYICLPDAGAQYNVPVAPFDLKASSDQEPPVREIAKPAENAASLRGGTWQSVAALPDWSGVWTYDNHPNTVLSTEPVPLKSPYAEKLVELRAIAKAGGDIVSDVYHCRPRGPVQLLAGAGGTTRIVFTPGRVTFVPQSAQTRRIYTDGRAHPGGLTLSFMGHSIGHWEGDTLVVDTVGLRYDVSIFNGMPATGPMHVVERVHLIAPNKLQIDTTIETPAFAEPWSYSRTFTRHTDWDLFEDYCTQNNRDVGEDGAQTFDLTPPPDNP